MLLALLVLVTFPSPALGQQKPIVGVVGMLAPAKSDPDAGLRVLAMQWAQDCIENGNVNLCRACGELQGRVRLQLVLRDTSTNHTTAVQAAQDIVGNFPNTSAFVALLDCDEAREVASRLQQPLVSPLLPDPRYSSSSSSSSSSYSNALPNYFRTAVPIRVIAEAMVTFLQFLQTHGSCWQKLVGIIAEQCTPQGLDHELRALLKADYHSTSYDPGALNFSTALELLHDESRAGRTLVIASQARLDSLQLVDQLQAWGLLNGRLVLTYGLLEAGVNDDVLEGGLAFKHASRGEEAFLQEWSNQVRLMDLAMVQEANPQFVVPLESNIPLLVETFEAVILVALAVQKQYAENHSGVDALRLIDGTSCIHTALKLDDNRNPKYRDLTGIFRHSAQGPTQVAEVEGRAVTAFVDLATHIPVCATIVSEGIKPGIIGAIVGIVAVIFIFLAVVCFVAMNYNVSININIVRRPDTPTRRHLVGGGAEAEVEAAAAAPPRVVGSSSLSRDIEAQNPFQIAVVGSGLVGRWVAALLAESTDVRVKLFAGPPRQPATSPSTIITLQKSLLEEDCSDVSWAADLKQMAKPSAWGDGWQTLLLVDLEQKLERATRQIIVAQEIPDIQRISGQFQLVVDAAAAPTSAGPEDGRSLDYALKVHFECAGTAAVPVQKRSKTITLGQLVYLLDAHPGAEAGACQMCLFVRLPREEHQELRNRIGDARTPVEPSLLVLWTQTEAQPWDVKLASTPAVGRITDGLKLFGCTDPHIRQVESIQHQSICADAFTAWVRPAGGNVSGCPRVRIGDAAMRAHPYVRSSFTASLMGALVATRLLLSTLQKTRESGQFRLEHGDWSRELQTFENFMRRLGEQQMHLSGLLRPLQTLPALGQAQAEPPSQNARGANAGALGLSSGASASASASTGPAQGNPAPNPSGEPSSTASPTSQASTSRTAPAPPPSPPTATTTSTPMATSASTAAPAAVAAPSTQERESPQAASGPGTTAGAEAAVQVDDEAAQWRQLAGRLSSWQQWLWPEPPMTEEQLLANINCPDRRPSLECCRLLLHSASENVGAPPGWPRQLFEEDLPLMPRVSAPLGSPERSRSGRYRPAVTGDAV